jgi:hypothetical protein
MIHLTIFSTTPQSIEGEVNTEYETGKNEEGSGYGLI